MKALPIAVLVLVGSPLFGLGSGEAQKIDEPSGSSPFSERRAERSALVDEAIARQGVSDPAVLDAMRRVPRHRFVPSSQAARAYLDRALPIGYGQTISQPYVVAFMTEALELTSDDKVLEIGTGSGYQAAVLAEIVSRVYSIEIVPELYTAVKPRLRELGYDNVHVAHGDGYFGWEEEAPFDKMIVTAAVDHVPPALLRQLAAGGKLILPLGSPGGVQTLLLITKGFDGSFERRSLLPVRFVPMTGAALR